MKITAVRLFEVRGRMAFAGEFWEERLIRPTDIYPEHKVEGHGWLSRIEDGLYEMRSQFCEIETDEGVTGLGGPTTADQAFIIRHQLAPLLIGHDPLATERIWDRLYRSMVHGRKGTPMMAERRRLRALGPEGRWARRAGLPPARRSGA